MTLFQPKIKKNDVAIFLENLSFLLSCGYTSYDAVYWVCESTSHKRDKESRRVQIIGRALLRDLSEGFALSTAMIHNPVYFGDYAKQVEAAEESGQVAEVLDQIVTNIRESGDLKHKIRSAMMYPIIVLTITIGIAWYLFSFVIPDILDMLTSVGGGDTPGMTQVIMNITNWMSVYAIPLILVVIAAILVLIVLAKGPFKMPAHRLYTKMPLISKISLASNVCTWMQSMRYMLYAGSPMANALSTAADSMTNIALKKEANEAASIYSNSGVAVATALSKCSFLTAMELSTINIGLEAGRITEVLQRLADRRKHETEKAITAFTTALNPIGEGR